MANDRTSRRCRDERGQASVVIIGFAALILMLVAVVVDASDAYLERQDLDSLADGAALYAADAAAEGREVYDGGLGDDDLRLDAGVARAAVTSYLRDAGAHRSHLALRAVVRVDRDTVRVTLISRVDLPFTLPGGPEGPEVRAVGSAVVRPE